MDIWAKSPSDDGWKQCEAILATMTELYEDGNRHVSPSIVTYNTLIDAYARRGMAQDAESVLLRLFDNSSTIAPDSISFHSVLNAWAKKAGYKSAERAENILKLLLSQAAKDRDDSMRPNTVMYSAVIDAWARSGPGVFAAERAERVLEMMIKSDNVPNKRTYNSMIVVWGNSGTLEGPKRAEAYFLMMKEKWLGGDESFKPTGWDYNALITAFSRSRLEKISFEKAQEYFREMLTRYNEGDESCSPSRKDYNVMVTLWARSRSIYGLLNAEKYFSMMKQQWLQGNEDCKLIVSDYNAMLDALAKSKQTEDTMAKATNLLDELKTHEEAGDSSCSPDQRTFAIYLCLLSRSKDVDKASKAMDILLEMDQRGLRTNVMDLNEILAACAWSTQAEDRSVIFDIAKTVFNRIQEGFARNPDKRDHRPDFRTYQRFFMSARGNPLSETRTTLEKAWKFCQEQGLDNDERVKDAHEKALSEGVIRDSKPDSRGQNPLDRRARQDTTTRKPDQDTSSPDKSNGARH